MIDLRSTQDINRLYTAIDASRRARDPFLRKRTEMIKDYVGSHYSDNGPQFRVMVNLMNQAADAYTIALAANCPRSRIVTRRQQLRPFAFRYQTSMNHYVQEIRLEDTLAKILLDGIFSWGVAKVYQQSTGWIHLIDDVWADPGRPYVERVSPDNFIPDMTASDLRKCRFMADEYRVSYSDFMQEESFNPEVKKSVFATSKYEDERNSTRAKQIEARDLTDDDELEPMTDLMDVWIPDLNVIATFPKHAETLPLAVRECEYEGGPYHIFCAADVPDNIMPSTPAQNLKELHDLFNGLFRKQAAQARRHKVNPTFRPGASDDADRLKKVNDGEWVAVADPSAINVITQGGIDQTNTAFSVAVMQLFDRMAGNLSAMLGLGPQAETLGQEQLIYGALSKKEAKLVHRFNGFTAGILRHVGLLMWNDELLSIQAEVEAPTGMGAIIDASWDERREGDFWEYQFSVEPYSMAYQPPTAKLQKIERAIAQLMNLWPMLQAQGGNFDIQGLVRLYAEMLDIPELEHIVTFAAPSPLAIQQEQGGASAPNQPHEYIRRNVSMGQTPQAQMDSVMQSLMAVGQSRQPQGVQ